MFRRHELSLEEVRALLIELIAQARAAANQQSKASFDPTTGQMTFNIIGISPQQLVPLARQIITRSIAKRLDAETRDPKKREILTLVGKSVLSLVPPEDVNLYVAVITLTVEEVLGIPPMKTMVRYDAAFAGADFHSDRAAELLEEKRHADAERELHQALQSARLWKEPHWKTMFILHDLGMSFYAQGQKEEAMKLFGESLAEYELLDAKIATSDVVKPVADDLKRYLGKG